MDNKVLIEAKSLRKYFKIPGKGFLHAVDDLSFSVEEGQTLGLVGESGCGKSTVGNVVMRLIPSSGGELLYRGKNVFTAGKEESLELRKHMQIIFQDPYSSLNPRKTIGKILSEAYEIHRIGTHEEITTKVHDLCDLVQIPKNLLQHYPHELDGGMRQVVGIARALSLDSDFIVCDEPVSSLDVSVQARIINLLMDVQKEKNISYLFISHDLSVVRHISNRVAVMYLGRIVEIADVDRIFRNTLHPYSIALLSAVPKVNVETRPSRIILTGDVPSPINPKPGCRFAARCWMAQPECFENEPILTEVEAGHCVACHYATKSQEIAKQIVATQQRGGDEQCRI
jgi:oligopeptide/dipeptide ABC transporter ATP-binding protein